MPRVEFRTTEESGYFNMWFLAKDSRGEVEIVGQFIEKGDNGHRIFKDVYVIDNEPMIVTVQPHEAQVSRGHIKTMKKDGLIFGEKRTVKINHNGKTRK